MNRRARFAALGAVILCGLGSLTGCGPAAHTVGAGPGIATTPVVAAPAGERSFLATSAPEVMFVRWTENAGTLSGSLDDVTQDQSTSTGTHAQEMSFTGLRHGDDVTLTLSQGLGTYSSLTGKISGDDLHLAVPQPDGQLANLTLSPASAADYNAAVADLATQASATAQAQADAQQQADAAASATAQAQADAQRQAAAAAQATAARAALDQAVTDADASFAADLDSVRQAVTTLAAEDLTFHDPLKESAATLAQTQKDLAATRREAQASRPDCVGLVSSDDLAVNSDETSVEDAQSNLESYTSTVRSETQQVGDALKQASDDLATLKHAVAADPSGPTPSHADTDLSAPRDSASTLVSKANKATADAVSTAAGNVGLAKTLNGQADTLNSRCTN